VLRPFMIATGRKISGGAISRGRREKRRQDAGATAQDAAMVRTWGVQHYCKLALIKLALSKLALSKLALSKLALLEAGTKQGALL
jgi:hypothetical protein